MATRYSAFLVRHWSLANGQERVEVQHIATGARHRCASVAEATAWLQGQARAPAARAERQGSNATAPAQPSGDGGEG